MPTTTADIAPLRVSIQGYAGAFHEAAARAHFADREVVTVEGHTFADVIRQLENGESDVALMAIENTLAGSLMANYLLLLEANVRITAEVYLRIHLNLLTLPGVEMSELREVHSHPIALMQCREFFRDYPDIELVKDVDTALSAREVREEGDRRRGAVASSVAADLYDLEVAARSIETNKLNHTRFLVLRRGRDYQLERGNKVSLSFGTGHESGSLQEVLSVLAAYGMNLTKIQSQPIIGRPWQYRIFLDFVTTGRQGLDKAISAIRPITSELHIQGVYPEGQKP